MTVWRHFDCHDVELAGGGGRREEGCTVSSKWQQELLLKQLSSSKCQLRSFCETHEQNPFSDFGGVWPALLGAEPGGPTRTDRLRL